MAVSYCETADLYDGGLPRGGVPNRGRALVACDTSANSVTLAEHGLVLGDPIEFRAEAGGTLPAPLVAGTTYYAVPLTPSTLSVSATSGGAAIDLTAAGTPDRVLLVTALQTRIDAARAWASRLIDDMIPPAAVPLSLPVPELVKFTCAELAIGKLLAGTGGSKPLSEMVDSARKVLARWAQNVPIRGENAPTPTAIAQAATVPFADTRGWSQFGGLRGVPTRGGRC